MSTFVCVETPGRVTWFESEQHYYDGQPTLLLDFAPRHNVWVATSRRPTTRATTPSIASVMRLLRNFPTADVSRFVTHTVSEPGAPLEPIAREVPA